MNSDFPRIITLLRKERGLSQKQVSADLGISQALLSHYEKGIRECGLDFLVKTAEYYDVSCDYLLGRTPQRNGSVISASDIPDTNEVSSGSKINILCQINKKLIMNSTSVIFDILAQLDNKNLTNAVSNYLMSAEYQIFRTIYSGEPSNSQKMFSLGQSKYRSLCSASMTLDLTIIDTLIESKNGNSRISLSPDLISKYFEKGASSLFNLIQSSEKSVKMKFK